METNTVKRRKILFLAQPGGTLVGPGKPFADHWELCRHARKEWGFTGVSAPTCPPYVDIDGMATSDDVLKRTLDAYEECGTPLIRLESHCDGMRTVVTPHDAARIAGFGPNELLNVHHRQHESAAEKRMLKIVEVSARAKFTELVDFGGNRLWHALSAFPAWPKLLLLYMLLLQIFKHRTVLRRCAELGIKRCFELHPGMDLNSAYLLFLFRELAKIVAPEIVAAIFANGDPSHPTMAGDSAANQFRFLVKHGLLGAVHLKDAALRNQELSAEEVATAPDYILGGSIRGDFAPRWSRSCRFFCSYGTGDSNLGVINPLILASGVRDMVAELECSRFPDMTQGAEIVSQNIDRMMTSQPMLDWRQIPVRQSTLGNWEEFAVDPKQRAQTLAFADSQEDAGVMNMLSMIQGSPLLALFE